MRRAVLSVGLICFMGPAIAEPLGTPPPGPFYNHDAKLNELRAAPEPKKQSDLDTVRLATAPRERAASVEEKTNGLWQSWLTSVCEGCGDTPSYRKTVDDDFANRKSVASRGSVTVAARQGPRRALRDKPEGYGRRLYATLSPEAVGQIRRMPRQ